MPETVYPILVTFFEHENPFCHFTSEAEKATAFVDYAQLCGYGITIERIDSMPIQWMPTASTMFDAIAHNPQTNELHVRFKNGKRYVHRGVTADDHQAFLNAESLGRHYNANIKGRFVAEPVEE